MFNMRCVLLLLEAMNLTLALVKTNELASNTSPEVPARRDYFYVGGT